MALLVSKHPISKHPTCGDTVARSGLSLCRWTSPTLATTVVALLLCPGCGLGLTDDRSGGADNLPRAAVLEYERLERDDATEVLEPVVFTVSGAELLDPTVIVDEGESTMRLWFTYRAAPFAEGSGEIWYGELSSLFEPPLMGPERALVAGDDWEQGWVASPTVVRSGPDRLTMFYEAGDPGNPSIGRADSSDNGYTWTRHPGNPVVPSGRSPSAVIVDGQWMLFGSREGVIVRATSDDGVTWSESEAVLRPRTPEDDATSESDGDDRTFDRYRLAHPYVIAIETPAGRTLLVMVYVGARQAQEAQGEAIPAGVAASFDGVNWERPASGAYAIKATAGPINGPAVWTRGSESVLFFSERVFSRPNSIVAALPR
jgi:hypothetical protein